MNFPSHHPIHAMADVVATPQQPTMRRPSHNMQQYQEHVAAQQALLEARHSQEEPHFGTIQDAINQPQFTPRSFVSRNDRRATPRTSAFTPTAAPRPSPARPSRMPLLRYTSALNAQIAHQWNPCWRPTSGAAGVPLTDSEQIPHVTRLMAAFLDTSLVLDSMEASRQFVAGGTWVQSSSDVELVSWNLVQACMSLHIVGAVTLRARRMPSSLPAADSSDSGISFGVRLFFLEVLVRHFKQYAHQMMAGTVDVEQQLMWIHTFLFKKQRFTEVMQKGFTPEQRERVLGEFQRRKSETNAATARSVRTTQFVPEEAYQHPRPRQGRTEEAMQPPQQPPSHLPNPQDPRPAIPYPATIRGPTPSPPLPLPSDPHPASSNPHLAPSNPHPVPSNPKPVPSNPNPAPSNPNPAQHPPLFQPYEPAHAPVAEFSFDDWMMFPPTR
ncbi:hypothetical protein PMIN06_005787 [Paraphaeosphaeria minitans]